MSLNTALTVGVLVFVGYRLTSGARFSASREGRTLIGEIVRGLRWRHVWPVPFVVTGVVALAAVLVRIPGLSWGWWSAIGGAGNPVIGSTTETAGTVWEWLIPLAFLVLLLPALPLFAHAEERIFRQGAQWWSPRRRAWMVVKFGLAHALIGIPIGVALALSVGGAYFMAVYLRAWRHGARERAATLESTRAHTAYNATILGLVLVAVVVEALA
jgi:hypothetical protein